VEEMALEQKIKRQQESKIMYKWIYHTPDNFSDMVMYSDGTYLTGLSFIHSLNEQKHDENAEEKLIDIFKETIHWLDIYFSGQEPDFVPNYKINGFTAFRKEVVDEMNRIPYGKTVTYGEIAKRIAEKHGIEKMSAQAVGGAVGWNPICLIVPCHRVMGANGKITGYGGGIENKIGLLELESKVNYDNKRESDSSK